jgi:hypothetical protein
MTTVQIGQPPAANGPGPTSVPCEHCDLPIAQEAFTYWATARAVVGLFASCPACGHDAKLKSTSG